MQVHATLDNLCLKLLVYVSCNNNMSQTLLYRSAGIVTQSSSCCKGGQRMEWRWRCSNCGNALAIGCPVSPREGSSTCSVFKRVRRNGFLEVHRHEETTQQVNNGVCQADCKRWHHPHRRQTVSASEHLPRYATTVSRLFSWLNLSNYTYAYLIQCWCMQTCLVCSISRKVYMKEAIAMLTISKICSGVFSTRTKWRTLAKKKVLKSTPYDGFKVHGGGPRSSCCLWGCGDAAPPVNCSFDSTWPNCGCRRIGRLLGMM